MEAEYIALYHATLNAVWIQNFLEQLDMAPDAPLKIYCDNQPAIEVAKGEAPHKKSKHFQIKTHLVRHYLQKRLTDVEFVPTEDNQADVLTKPLSKKDFAACVSGLGLRNFPASLDPDNSSDSQYADATE